MRSYEGNVHTIPSCCAFASNAILPFKGNVENVLKEFKEFLENVKSPLNKENLFHFTETAKYKNPGKYQLEFQVEVDRVE